MNWKDEIDKRHKGQSGFFKEIEQPKRKRKTITMAKTKILLEIDEELLNAVQKQADENERSRSAEMRHIIKNGLTANKRVK
tara:strand:- start:95 stop:337 length:243 start_codon:yes stop_codon:yes gene_type:complete